MSCKFSALYLMKMNWWITTLFKIVIETMRYTNQQLQILTVGIKLLLENIFWEY